MSSGRTWTCVFDCGRERERGVSCWARDGRRRESVPWYAADAGAGCCWLFAAAHVVLYVSAGMSAAEAYAGACEAEADGDGDGFSDDAQDGGEACGAREAAAAAQPQLSSSRWSAVSALRIGCSAVAVTLTHSRGQALVA